MAAHLDATAKDRFKNDCQKALMELLQKSHWRIQRAAHQSLATLRHKPEGYGGTAFEADIFNLLHGILPYVMKWGRTNSPDGFCSLLYFEGNDLANVTKFNWSYDAKLSNSDEGYDFGMSEKRQMFDYVSALFRQKRLQTQGNRLNAHVIISNNPDKEKMKDAAQVLRRKHRLGKHHPALKLVLMMEDFVITLFQVVSSREMAFRRRWPYLSERLASMMTQENADGYVHLGSSEARSIVDWVLKQDEIETPVEHKSLREELRETMEQS